MSVTKPIVNRFYVAGASRGGFARGPDGGSEAGSDGTIRLMQDVKNPLAFFPLSNQIECLYLALIIPWCLA